jgi:hypothetical protein
LNVEVEKLIGHQKRRDGSIQFLVLWEGYPAEDATFRDVELFRTSPYGIRVVEDYLATFGDLPEELDAWVAKTDWIKAKKKAGAVVEADTAAKVLIDTGASENYVRGDEESSALWIMLELGDVAGDSEEEDFDYVDAWSKEGRM